MPNCLNFHNCISKKWTLISFYWNQSVSPSLNLFLGTFIKEGRSQLVNFTQTTHHHLLAALLFRWIQPIASVKISGWLILEQPTSNNLDQNSPFWSFCLPEWKLSKTIYLFLVIIRFSPNSTKILHGIN